MAISNDVTIKINDGSAMEGNSGMALFAVTIAV
jgi:hypothetical protein